MKPKPERSGREAASERTAKIQVGHGLPGRVPSGPKKKRESPIHLESIRRRAACQGGIAQLVERQLCKLDVAGSNPAASTNRRAVKVKPGV